MRPRFRTAALVSGLLLAPALSIASETVATAVYSRVSKGYKREKAKDGTFLPEYYVMTNGGRVDGTTGDITVDRVSYAEVAQIARRVLTTRSYLLAETTEQAELLLVLNWGSTIAPNGMHKEMNVASARAALAALSETSVTANQTVTATYGGQDVAKNAANGFNRSPQFATNEEMAVVTAAGSVEASFLQSLVDDRVRDRLNEANARVLGYVDDLAAANGIHRYAGGGDRYSDLIGDVEESRYYIVVSAYDFKELTGRKKKKLLWQTRVSVRSPGNSFDDTYLAMLKNASLYFGQNSGKLVRGEETKGTVELGELKYLGEAKEPAAEEAAEPEKEESP